jgi:phosphoribosyl-dephospho-CoA transferase
MEFRAHWLLRVAGAQALQEAMDAPGWVEESLKEAPWVVVRRAHGRDGLIPVGVRGAPGRREQRYAAWIREDAVLECKTPQMLAKGLPRLAPIMEELGLATCWGPGGGVGFELASGLKATTATSDLDIVIEIAQMDRETARKLLARLPDEVDVVLETAAGGIVLADYANNSSYVVRTKEGPRLHGCISVSRAGPTRSGISGRAG